jgi:transcriptional regulator with XRE-family HTH domain
MVTVWTSDQINSLRQTLRMDVASFARLAGVDARTITRWETGAARPTGSAEAVLNGLQESLASSTDTEELIDLLVKAAAVGGLAYLLVKLLSKKGS